MRCPISLVLLLFAATAIPLCALADSAGSAAAKGEFFIVPKDKAARSEDFHFRIGEVLQVKATGKLVEKIKEEWPRTAMLRLFFDGEHIADLQAPPLQVANGGELLLNFPLVRNAEDDTTRHAWDRLFRTKNRYLMTIQPSLAIGNELPLVVQSAQPFKFYIAKNWVIWLTVALGLAMLIGFCWYLVKKTEMLRDANSNYYSLGKCQMVFWGLLVVLSFVGLWILTGTMEPIPSQALILLGISGATGLSAVVIGNSKKAEIQVRLTNDLAELDRLRQQQRAIQQRQDLSVADLSSAELEPVTTLQTEIDARVASVGIASAQLGAGTSRGFWRDLCDDGNGLSFHRLQVVVWNLVLGAIFVHSVARVMSMPEFPDTLLTLLGISNATYLGFKIPEKL